MTHLGRTAFEAYVKASDGVTFDGKPIPSWDELDGDADKTRMAWSVAAVAAIEALCRGTMGAIVDDAVRYVNGQTDT